MRSPRYDLDELERLRQIREVLESERKELAAQVYSEHKLRAPEKQRSVQTVQTTFRTKLDNYNAATPEMYKQNLLKSHFIAEEWVKTI